MTNSIFNNETEMQKWLEETLKNYFGLYELISNGEELETFSPKNLEEKKIYSSFKNCLEALHLTPILSANQNISLSGNEILKPDLVLYSSEAQGIVIVELKNSVNASRQAGTEIGAYAAELKNHLLFLSDGDIFNIIISSEWKTLLKYHVLHEIFWKNRNILCLQPIKKENGDILLEILPIKELLNTKLTYQIPEEYLYGYQICLYDDELYKQNNFKERMEYFDSRINQMKATLSVMAVEGERQASHGFAFLWKDKGLVPNGFSLCPYNITLINIAPFESIERFFQTITDISELSEMQRTWVNLVIEQNPTGHGHTLNSIANVGKEFLSSFCKPYSEGYYSWQEHKIDMLNNCSDLIAFSSWGIFQSIFNEKLLAEYINGNLDIPIDSPSLGFEAIQEVIDENYQYISLAYIDLDEEQS